MEAFLAKAPLMTGNYNELLALVPTELAAEDQLLLGELKGFADRGGGVDAGEIEGLHELVAGLIQDFVLVAHADDMGGAGLKEDLASGFGVAAGYKYELERGTLREEKLTQLA